MGLPKDLGKAVEETHGILAHLGPEVSLVEELIQERREEARKEEEELTQSTMFNEGGTIRKAPDR